jgi:prophage antirepressor-like protein
MSAISIPITDDESANSIFNLINQAEQFGDAKIDIILCEINGEKQPWFKGKDVASILGYEKPTKSLSDHIDIDDRIYLELLLQKVSPKQIHPKYNKNQLKTTYINESGLYSLIINSKLKTAKQFKKWVTSILLPKIRKIGQEKYLLELQEKEKLLLESRRELQEKESQLNRLHDINSELLTYKKLSEKNESIYLVSTKNYIKQGLIKIGRTINIKSRNSSHNTTHVVGDKVVVLKEFKVNDSALVESIIHKKLNGLRPEKKSEFFMCPFDLLVSIVDLVVNNDDAENDVVNNIIDTVYKLKQTAFSSIDWMAGLPEDIFNEDIKMIENNKEIAKFDVTTATNEQKQNFVKECIEAYKRTIQQPNEAAQCIVWKAFQGFMIQKLNVPKSQFKATTWKPLLKTEEKNNNQLQIKWRE